MAEDLKTMGKITLQQNTEPALEWLSVVKEKVQSLRFGEVAITVHENRVTQIAQREKLRLSQGKKRDKTPVEELNGQA